MLRQCRTVNGHYDLRFPINDIVQISAPQLASRKQVNYDKVGRAAKSFFVSSTVLDHLLRSYADHQSPATREAKSRCGNLFNLTPSAEPCGIESFARQFIKALAVSDPPGGYEMLAIGRRWRDLAGVLPRVLRARQVVFNLPLVSWKRR